MNAGAAPSRIAKAVTWFVLALSVVLVALGIYWYGLSLQVHERLWSDIFARTHGPMTFRFFLQPVMAGIAALHDGINDARSGHKAFFWTALWDPVQPRGRLREGLVATSQMALIGFAMDLIYQFRLFDHFYPVEALMMVLLLAVIPYFVLRWIVEHAARWWFARTGRLS